VSSKQGKRGARTKKKSKPEVSRLGVLNELRMSATDAWAKSTHPVKKRVGRLEIAWREGMQWMAEDIQKMFRNFAIIGDAYDQQDLNVAALKGLLLEKGIITEEEFQAKRGFFSKLLIAERERRQAELKAVQEAAEAKQAEDAEIEAKADEAALGAADGSTVTPELKRMHKAAQEAGSDELHVPEGVTVFGG